MNLILFYCSAIESPHILELSGIGDHNVLEPLEIPVQLDLPSVGTNVQDRIIIQGPAYSELSFSFPFASLPVCVQGWLMTRAS